MLDIALGHLRMAGAALGNWGCRPRQATVCIPAKSQGGCNNLLPFPLHKEDASRSHRWRTILPADE